jgi:hypothetical protein
MLSRTLTRPLSRSLSRPITGWGGSIADIFVDSVNGSDSNDGLSQSAPLQTLAAAQAITTDGKTIGFARGSYWREQYNISANNVGFVTYGTGAMPVIDGADPAGTWTQPDSVTYPNVWSQSWTRTSATTTASEILGLWENGARPARYATSLADLQTNGGWYASSLTTQTATVYIKAASDPNTDGVAREITRRHYGISGHTTTLGVTRTGQSIVGPLEIKRCVGHYNALSLGSGTAKKMLLRDGNIHHSVTEGSLLEDILAAEYSPNIGPSVFVAYKASGAGFSSTFRRLIIPFSGGSARAGAGSSAFYSHSATTREPEELAIEGCAARGLDFANASSKRLVINGAYCEDPYQIVVAEAAILNRVSHLIVHDTAPTPLAAGNQVFRRLDNASTFEAYHVASNTLKGACIRNVAGGAKPVIDHCAICNTTSGAGLYQGEYAMTNTVIYTNGRPLDLVTNLYTGDFNVFYFIGQSNPILHWNGTLYSSSTTAFSSYVAASGQDQNSVYLKSTDQTSGNQYAFWLGISTGVNSGPASGDYRINPNARVYDKDNTARIGVFGDGITPITEAGPQQHWDFNLRSLVSGPPSRIPVLPSTIADMRTYVENPAAWNFYP